MVVFFVKTGSFHVAKSGSFHVALTQQKAFIIRS
jgi:hypothetical protein